MWLQRINNSTERMLSDNNIEINSIIKLNTNLSESTFEYEGNYYTTNDFIKIEIVDENDPTLKLLLLDYDYVDFNNINDLEYEIVIVPKPLIPQCNIKRYDSSTFGIVCEKPVDDNNISTYAYKYKKADGSLSELRIGVEGEWYSIDTMNVMQLTKLEKIKYLLKQKDKQDNILDNIYKIVYN